MKQSDESFFFGTTDGKKETQEMEKTPFRTTWVDKRCENNWKRRGRLEKSFESQGGRTLTTKEAINSHAEDTTKPLYGFYRSDHSRSNRQT